MDKKRFHALAVAALLALMSAAGCEDKKESQPVSSEIMGDYTETIAAVTEAPVFKEYAESDFRDINLKLTVVDKEPPVEVTSVDISGLDFGSRVVINNSEEYAEEYYNSMLINPDGQPVYDWREFVNKPSEGAANKCYVYGGKCYIFVMYENTQLFDWTVFSYDMAGGKPEEVYSWAAETLYDYCDINVCFSEGSLFFNTYRMEGENINSTVKRLDLETGGVTVLLERNDPSNDISLNTDDTGAVFLTDNHSVSMEEPEILIYNRDKDEFVKDSDIEAPEGKIIDNNCFNGAYSYLIKPEGKRKYVLVNDYYRIGTALTTGRIVYADEKLAVLYNGSKLHIYDLEKMEHCIIDVSDMGRDIFMYEGMLFIGFNGSDYKMPVYCIIPELGITYPIVEDGIYKDICVTDGSLTFNEITVGLHEITYEATDENGVVGTYGFSHMVDEVTKLYTVKVK